jgi:hypothetical protein
VAEDSWEPWQNIHALALIRDFHKQHPTTIKETYLNPLDDNEPPSHSLNTSYPSLIPLPQSHLSFMSVNNGAQQEFLQGGLTGEEAVPSSPISTTPTHVDTPQDAIPSDSTDDSTDEGGNSFSGEGDVVDNGRRDRSANVGSDRSDELSFRSHPSPTLTSTGHRSAWYPTRTTAFITLPAPPPVMITNTSTGAQTFFQSRPGDPLY